LLFARRMPDTASLTCLASHLKDHPNFIEGGQCRSRRWCSIDAIAPATRALTGPAVAGSTPCHPALGVLLPSPFLLIEGKTAGLTESPTTTQVYSVHFPYDVVLLKTPPRTWSHPHRDCFAVLLALTRFLRTDQSCGLNFRLVCPSRSNSFVFASR
jgi:hypothetical protein